MLLGWIVLTLTAVGLAAALLAAWLAFASVRVARAQDEAREADRLLPCPPQPTEYSREAAHPSRVGYALYHLHRYRDHRQSFDTPPKNKENRP